MFTNYFWNSMLGSLTKLQSSGDYKYTKCTWILKIFFILMIPEFAPDLTYEC